MARYFFDTHDGELIRDEIGLEMAGIEEARDAATHGLVDLAHDAIPGALRRELVGRVRDEQDRVLIEARLWLEVAVLVP